MNSTSKSSIEKALRTAEQICSIGDLTILKEKKTRYSINLKEKRE